MSYTLLRSEAFIRAARRVTRRNPDQVKSIEKAVDLLAEDPFQPALKTHKLKGKLSGSWGCSAQHDMRIIFRFVEYEGAQAILLQSVGTHDEVY